MKDRPLACVRLLRLLASVTLSLAAAVTFGEVKTLNLDFTSEGFLSGTVTSLNSPGGNVWNQFDLASFDSPALVDQFGVQFDLIGDPTGTDQWIPFPNISVQSGDSNPASIAVRELANTSPVDMSIIFEDVGGTIFSQNSTPGRNALPFTINFQNGVDSLGLGFIDYLGPDVTVTGSLQFTGIFGAGGLRTIGVLTLRGLSPFPTTIGDPPLPGVTLDIDRSASIKIIGMQVSGQFVNAPEPSGVLIALFGIAALLPSSRSVR